MPPPPVGGIRSALPPSAGERTSPRATSAAVMPSVSSAPQVRAALAHVSSSVQAGSSFSRRVSTCPEVRCIATSTHPAWDSWRTIRKSGAWLPASKGTTRSFV